MSVKSGPEQSIYQGVFCRKTGFEVFCGVVHMTMHGIIDICLSAGACSTNLYLG